jgi:hypothetical protein
MKICSNNLVYQKDIRPAHVEGTELSLCAVFMALCMKICSENSGKADLMFCVLLGLCTEASNSLRFA